MRNEQKRKCVAQQKGKDEELKEPRVFSAQEFLTLRHQQALNRSSADRNIQRGRIHDSA